ncbi:hypothetical protein JCM10213v2_000732 [Rhodosporidiobolus nylandii]
MPPSPPPPRRPTSPSSSVIRADPSTTEEALLRLLEGAHDDAPGALSSGGGVPPFHSSPDDLAGEMLAQRHADRREREREHELEWDEQDNARRARALLDRLFPGEGGAPSASRSALEASDDDDEDMVGWAPAESLDFLAEHINPSVMAGGVGEGEDERVFGFDGDDFDDLSMALEGGEDNEYYPGRITHEMSSLWPGFIGQRPLNPPPVSSASSSRAPPTVASTLPQRSLPRDPSSATSYTSFLEPGMVFLGEQTFGRAEMAASLLRHHGQNPRAAIPPHLRDSSANRATPTGSITDFFFAQSPHPSNDWAGNPLRHMLARELGDELEAPGDAAGPSTAHPAFAPFPAARASRLPPSFDNIGPSSSFAIPRPGHSSSSSSARYAPYAQPASSSADLSSLASSSLPSQFGTAAPALSASSSAAVDRARARIAQLANPQARSSRNSWREVESEMLQRAAERAGGPSVSRNAPAGRAAKSEPAEQERWGVKVVIQSYFPAEKTLSGIMRAQGVAPPPTASNPSPRPPQDVLTHFTGHIIDPVVDGLFVSPSPTGAGGNGDFKVSRRSEAESWTHLQLGPFRNMTGEDLLRCAQSKEWCEEKTRGWVLWRLKERGFVNVTDSELSISGFYHIALNRATGEIEGLYSDPSATPFQRLTLSATHPKTGAFSLGTFGLR